METTQQPPFTPVSFVKASHENTHTFYVLAIAILLLAWIVTLIAWYWTHKPCSCRGVVVQHPQPTTVPHRIPFVGTFHVPVITSPPSVGSSLETVLDYLRKKGSNLAGQPFNAEIHKALGMPWLWQWNTTYNPPVGIFPAGVTATPYYVVYDNAQHQWTITTTFPS
jgi:hypothetical protein